MMIRKHAASVAVRRQALLFTTALVSSLCLSLHTASAADPANTSSVADDNGPIETVVVTGTLIRGIAPTGSQVIGVSSADVTASGAITSDELLATVPQVNNFFNTIPQNFGAGANGSQQINRPSLRPLPNENTSSGAATLVLVDGHRMVGAGVNQDATDPDVVPPSLIDHVDIVTDGNSAIYGSDAVGGVINFITKRSFDGAEVDFKDGFADGYNSVSTAVTVGHDWGSGSAFLSYGYTTHTAIYARDRDWLKNIDWSGEPFVPSGNGMTYVPSGTLTAGIPSGRECASPNIVAPSGDTYAVLNGTFSSLNSFNACDLGKNETMYPQEDRHNIFAGASQDITNWLRFDVRAYYTQRGDYSNAGSLATSATISPTNAYYQNLPGADSLKSQTISFNFDPITGPQASVEKTRMWQWGVTPTLTADIAGDWQVRAMFNYGQSTTTYDNNTINSTLLTQYTGAGATSFATAIDPYNIAATQNKQLVSNLLNSENFGQGEDEIVDGRIVADGTVFTLPAGAAHAAAGLEYLEEHYQNKVSPGTGTTPIGGQDALPWNYYSRNVRSVFVDAEVPIFGEGFRMPLVYSLTLEGAARYDEYSDFGETINPHAGVNYHPIEWINFRGNWGTSFNAPTAVDELGTKTNSLIPAAEPIFPPPAGFPQPGTGSYALIIFGGTTSNLQPQTARTKSVGIDIDPPWVPGLTASTTYYHIDYEGALGLPPFFNSSTFWADYSKYYVINPTQAQIIAFASQVPGGLAAACPYIQKCTPGGPTVFALEDGRRSNIGNAIIGGFDWSLKYAHDTDFGSVDARLDANNALENRTQAGPGGAWVDQLSAAAASGGTSTAPKFNFAATVGANIGDLRAQATLNHSQGYRLISSPDLPQSHIGSFNVVNLFFLYDLDNAGWFNNATKDMTVTLNIDNIFDTAPPVYESFSVNSSPGLSGGGVGNGSTLGRVIALGFSKKF